MSFFTNSLIIADVAPNRGYTKNFDYCLKIGNLKQYPNHQFFAQVRSQNSNLASTPYTLIKTDRCIPMNGYRPIATIAAIAKNKVQRNDLKNTSSGTILKNSKLQKFLIQGKPTIDRPDALPIINEGKQVEATYKIQSIDSKGLQLESVNESVSISNLILFPLIGATILGWTIWKRKQTTVSE